MQQAQTEYYSHAAKPLCSILPKNMQNNKRRLGGIDFDKKQADRSYKTKSA